MKNIVIASRKKAQEFSHENPWAAISVSSEVGEHPYLDEENRIGLLQLAFYDNNSFQKHQAIDVLEFVDNIWNKAECLLIHCEAGMSRSPAIGAAVAKIKWDDDSRFFKNYIPNNYVYRLILETYWGQDKEIIVPKTEEKIYDEPWSCTD